MTLEEAMQIAEIMAMADGHCKVCSELLVDHANEVFPDFHFAIHPNWWGDSDGEGEQTIMVSNA